MFYINLHIRPMKKIVFPLTMVIVSLLMLACQKEKGLPVITFPTVSYSVKPENVTINNTMIVTGPSAIYEQGSYVVYKLTLTAASSIKQMRVQVLADYIALDSKVIATFPANLCDSIGNFTTEVTEAVVYYRLHIHPLIVPNSTVKVTFSVLDNDLYRMEQSNSFKVIKSGSSAGKQFNLFFVMVGTQEALKAAFEVPQATGNGPYVYNAENVSNLGNYFSLDRRVCYAYPSDALRNSDKVDWIGYRYMDVPLVSGNWALGETVKTVRTTSVPAYQVGWAFVSPYDTATLVTDTLRMGYYLAANYRLPLPAAPPVVGKLISTYLAYQTSYGALCKLAQTVKKFPVKNNVQFKKISLTPEQFDQTSHNNELSALTAGSPNAWAPKTKPLQPDEVYAFKRADGTMGMFKVIFVPVSSTYDAISVWIKY